MTRKTKSLSIFTAFLLLPALCLGGCDQQESGDDELAERVALHVGLDDYEVLDATDEHRQIAATVHDGEADRVPPSSPAPSAATHLAQDTDVMGRIFCGEFDTGSGDGACGFCSFKGAGRNETNCFADEAACGDDAGQCVSEEWFDPTPAH